MSNLELIAEIPVTALRLSMNCVLALHRAGLMPPEQAEYCATELERLAGISERASSPDDLPPKFAEQLHTLALLLGHQGKPPRTEGDE